MKALLRRALRTIFSPLRGDLESRFLALERHVDDSIGHGLRKHLDHRLDDLENRVGWVEDRVNDRAGDVQARLDQLETRVTIDTQTAAEFTATFRRATDKLYGEMSSLTQFVTAGTDPHLPELVRRSAHGDPEADVALARLLHDLVPGAADRVVGEHVGVTLPDLGPGAAALLNWASGHTGPSGQAHVWLNPPLTVLHGEGWVRPNEVNERIVEVPYACGAAAGLAVGSHVLDFGATESTFALSMASMGHHVIAADLRRYPFEHPQLQSATGPIEDWPGPDQLLDAIFSISAIEHAGLGAYGEGANSEHLDRIIVERFADWLRPGGELVFTAPYGLWAVDDQQRVYDRAHLDALLAGWQITDLRVCVQTAPDRWERVEELAPSSMWDEGRRGVVLLRAVPER